MNASRLGENVPECGGGKRDDGRVNPEYRVLAHDLHVPIFKVECIVMSVRPLAIALSDVIA